MLMRPCIDCGEPSENPRCDEHTISVGGQKTSADSRGYDHAWRKLSQRARRLQPFCSDCGATTDLQCDHSPQAWARKLAGKPIRLKDVDVVCGPCNRKRGAARDKSEGGGYPLIGGTTTREGDAKFLLHSASERIIENRAV